MIARHVRCYDRRQDFEHPNHPHELLAQRRKAYYQELQQRSLNTRHHIRRHDLLDLERQSPIWPKKINRLQVQNLFRLHFVKDKTNIIFPDGIGLGKTHLATVLDRLLHHAKAVIIEGKSYRMKVA